MQQRRPRLGDILDDYCPRERRITNHAVVAMIDEEVKQTRCTTCEADHEYKQARMPTPRRKKEATVIPGDAPEDSAQSRPALVASESIDADSVPETSVQEVFDAPVPPALHGEAPPERDNDEGPVHRRLIRATLPRPDGQLPERKAPEFTVRQPGARDFDGNQDGNRHGRGRRMRSQGGGGNVQSQRFGGPRQGHSSRHGDGRPAGPGGSHRGGGHPGQGQGHGRGPRTGAGRKRGR